MNSTVIWDDDPGGNVEHVAGNGRTPDEMDEVLLDPPILAPVTAYEGPPH